MEFEDYLKSKKIDPIQFKNAEKDLFDQFETLFNTLHPNSFTQQKLFLINKLRRTYNLTETSKTESSAPQRKLRPKILPKPKLK